mmetsp:Transcript_5409/g.7773  ORF Transcript_5409/g.7773 Transcript_5409/m.7773 type:complete len:121 (-) Transcript_5409:172-534(-)
MLITQQDPEMLDKAYKWITRRGYILSFLLIIVWPVLSVPAGIFSKSYFAFWVLISIVWGFGAACAITFIPIFESSEEIFKVGSGIINYLLCRGKPPNDDKDAPRPTKSIEDPEEAPVTAA